MNQKKYRLLCSALITFMAAVLYSFLALPGNILADASDPNLIPNPSMETASADPAIPASWLQGGYGTNTATLNYPVAGYAGNRAAQVKITSYTDGDAKWYFEPVAITPGTYQFSDYYKSDIKTYLVAQYESSGGALSYVDLLTVEPAANWTRALAIFTVPAGTTKITIFHLLANNGTLTVDNYSLQSYSAPVVPPPTANNMIINPSFEYAGADGKPIGWYPGNWGTNTANFNYPISGFTGNGASSQITAYTNGDAKWYFEPVAVKDNYRYLFSDYYRSDATSIIEAQALLQDGTYQYIPVAILSPATSWTKFTGEIIAPTNAKSMTVFHYINTAGLLAVDEYSLSETGSAAFSQGMVSLNFDDGWLSAYRYGYPIFKSMGLRTTHNLIADGFDDTANYISLAQAKSIQDSGDEIGSHTKTHANLIAISAEQLANETSGAKKLFASKGINVATFAYPFGSYNDQVIAAVKNAGYTGARSSDPGFNNKVGDKYKLAMQSVENTTKFSQIREWIDAARANKAWLILLFHKVQPNTAGEQYSTTPTIVTQTAAYLKLINIPVVTNSQGLRMMNN